MTTAAAMRQQKLKYFSALTSNQKDKSILFVRKYQNNLLEIADGLAKTILREIDDLKPINLSGCKMFKHNGVWVPINIKDFKK